MKKCLAVLFLVGCATLPNPPPKKAAEIPRPLKIVCKNGHGHGVPISRNVIITVGHVGQDAIYAEQGKHKLPLLKVAEYITPGESEKVVVFQVANPVLIYYEVGRGNPYTVDTPRGNIDWRDYIPVAGDSGCPVLNKHGEVIGLVSGVGQKFGVGILVVQKPVIISVRKVH